jgi:hypothetical protein
MRESYLATLVERQSRFVVGVADKRTETVVAALIRAVRKLGVAYVDRSPGTAARR